MVNLSRTKALCFDKTDIFGNVVGSVPLKGAYERMRSYKGVDISGKSGIMKERSKKNIIVITDTAVESVPKVKISGYSDEQCAFVQQQHKELLRYARDNNDGKEVAFVFRKDLTDRTEYIGIDDSLDFGAGLFGKGDDLFIMHNHPRNSGFSYDDLVEFIRNDNIQSLTIAKNNGNIEVLNKHNSFDKKAAAVDLKRIIKNISQQELMQNII